METVFQTVDTMPIWAVVAIIAGLYGLVYAVSKILLSCGKE